MNKYESYYEAKVAAIKKFTENALISDELKHEIHILHHGYYQNPEREALDLKYSNMNIDSKEALLSLPLVSVYYNYLNDSNKTLVTVYMDRMPYISNSNSGYIRSYKTHNCYKDVLEFIDVLEVFLSYQFINFDIVKYIGGKEYFTNSYSSVSNRFVCAVLASSQADSVVAAIKKMIYESEGIKNISYELVRGMITSGNEQAIEIVMDLLKSAKLSEGLRQSVVDNIDLGSFETYKYFLEYIRAENLNRFSSVKRSFLTFTGMEYELGDKGIDNLGDYIMEVLLDDKTSEYLTSENALKYYLGLYALACVEFDDAINHIQTNYAKLPGYKKSVALYFLSKSAMTCDADLITQVFDTETNLNNILIVMDNLPAMTFKNDTAKKNYIKAYIKASKPLKATSKYSVFVNDVNQSTNYYQLSNGYNTVLKLVDELNDLYEEAYAIFDKRYSTYGNYVIKEIKHPIVRQTIIKGIGSNLENIRSFSIAKIEELKIELSKDEYLYIAGFMKSKRSDTRKYVSKLLSKANVNIILEACNMLLENRNKNCQSGAISVLVDNLSKVNDNKGFVEIKSKIETMNFDDSIVDSVALVLGDEKEERQLFFDNNKQFPIPALSYNKSQVDEFLSYKADDFNQLVNEFYAIFEKHSGEEVEFSHYDGSTYRKKAAYDFSFVQKKTHREVEGKAYKNYVFYQDFTHYAEIISPMQLLMYNMISYLLDEYNSALGRSWDDDNEKIDYFMDNRYLPDWRPLFATYYDEDDDTIEHKINNFSMVIAMLIAYMEEEKGINVYNEFNELLANVAAYIVEKDLLRKANGDFADLEDDEDEDDDTPTIPEMFFSEFSFISHAVLSKSNKYFDDNYIYMLLQNLMELYKGQAYPWESIVEFNLVEKGVMPQEQLYQLVFDTQPLAGNRYSTSSHSQNILSDISNAYSYKRKLSKLQKDVYEKAISFMVEVELDRTERDTEYSSVISSCHRFFGCETYIKAISKMGKIPFVRGYSWGEEGKKESFSNIIANVRAEDTLTQEQFNSLVKQYKVDKVKLLEASMYNLDFISFVEQYLKIKGLTKAAYFFKAHMNESLTDDEKKIIRRYSDIAFNDFENGQMDINWFKESYDELGKNNFALVYDAAKYITDGGKHKRAQYFADAVLGKLKIKEVEGRINDKRNQEMILAYGLLPLRGNKDNAALKRYKRLQLFLKQSKEYGAQRRQSEALKVSIAMNNLARNYGVSADQFSWMMESKLIEKVKGFFAPKQVEDIHVHIDLANVINPQIIVKKADKILKSIPAKLNKHAYIKELKETKKQLKDQYRRAKHTLEQAMINEDEFSYEQLVEINNHPVIKGILKDLLFVSDGHVGFFKLDKLVGLSESYPLFEQASRLKIAHPTDLLNNDWIAWQNHIIQSNIKQAFKQVFRELYTMTKEEIENDGYTNRFAGYQVEGRRMLGVMKSRGWMINDYDGFEKINHKSNLRVDLYSYADWFTPNDVEQPSIEKVVFLDNRTNKAMDMQTLSPILFSETMRDIDLVVSVAYVGGVDPVYQHTTIEMRKRILEYNLSLFKIANYEISENHIVVKGTLGTYSIHIGSGVIHMKNKGMLPVFPVHSQQRGHIFLPFVDEDPKTSEIITKVLMLAKDNEIKDPSILMHLK